MKIVIFVDYSNSNFNNDFKLSNMLIERGHNVFLAINKTQFDELKKNCDLAVCGVSSDFSDLSYDLHLDKNNDIEYNLNLILQKDV